MNNIKLIVCRKHGYTEHVLRKDGKYRCKKCTCEHVSEKRRQIKLELIKYKGGKCEICGYDKCIAALEFHHIDPKTKKFGIGNGNIKSLNILKQEVDKCLLLCNRCHTELHYQQFLEKHKQEQKEIEENISKYKENREKYNSNINTSFNKIKNLNKEEIQKDLDEGLKYNDIINKYDISLATLKRFIYGNDLTRKVCRKMQNLTVDDFIKSAINNDCVKTKIALDFGVNVKSLEEWCVRNNLPRNKKEIKQYIENIKNHQER